jgi:hypothetical protein
MDEATAILDLKAFFTKVQGWFLIGLKDFAIAEPWIDDIVSCIPSCPPIVSKILEALPSVIASAEQALGDGTGAIKMTSVLSFFQSALSAVDSSLNVGTDTFFAKIEPAIKDAINKLVAGANAAATASAAAADVPKTS